ncbi:hypothetical protein AK88_05626 [Plasmodium fragile]|uniref:Schizont-infected cell agglutination extracellular alpha domain-containing protein n=1 Tax=Plasmodium fragile TaxID=5857 RepID=A0A0D9QGB1_PLAFR|nr:uncharacterized protein AK88_05626 [Plasmodium fragile]KJP84741.1 hypothetical protein AK88_05626 [Plasmodium fragile]
MAEKLGRMLADYAKNRAMGGQDGTYEVILYEGTLYKTYNEYLAGRTHGRMKWKEEYIRTVSSGIADRKILYIRKESKIHRYTYNFPLLQKGLWDDIQGIFGELKQALVNTEHIMDGVCNIMAEDEAKTLQRQMVRLICKHIIRIIFFANRISFKDGHMEVKKDSAPDGDLRDYLRCMVGNVAAITLYSGSCNTRKTVRKIIHKVNEIGQEDGTAYPRAVCAGLDYDTLKIGSKFFATTMGDWIRTWGKRNGGQISTRGVDSSCDIGNHSNTSKDREQEGSEEPIVKMFQDNTAKEVRDMIGRGDNIEEQKRNQIMKELREKGTEGDEWNKLMQTIGAGGPAAPKPAATKPATTKPVEAPPAGRSEEAGDPPQGPVPAHASAAPAAGTGGQQPPPPPPRRPSTPTHGPQGEVGIAAGGPGSVRDPPPVKGTGRGPILQTRTPSRPNLTPPQQPPTTEPPPGNGASNRAKPVAAKPGPAVTPGATASSGAGGGGKGGTPSTGVAVGGQHENGKMADTADKECDADRILQQGRHAVYVVPPRDDTQWEKWKQVLQEFTEYMQDHNDLNEAYGANCYNSGWNDFGKGNESHTQQRVADVVRCRVMSVAWAFANWSNTAAQDTKHGVKMEKEEQDMFRCEVVNIFGHLLKEKYCSEQKGYKRGVEYSRIVFKSMKSDGAGGIGVLDGPVIQGKCTACGYEKHNRLAHAINLKVVQWLMDEGKISSEIAQMEMAMPCRELWKKYINELDSRHNPTTDGDRDLTSIKERLSTDGRKKLETAEKDMEGEVKKIIKKVHESKDDIMKAAKAGYEEVQQNAQQEIADARHPASLSDEHSGGHEGNCSGDEDRTRDGAGRGIVHVDIKHAGIQDGIEGPRKKFQCLHPRNQKYHQLQYQQSQRRLCLRTRCQYPKLHRKHRHHP